MAIQKITLISGELQVRIEPKQTTEKILKMDLEGEPESTTAEHDFAIMDEDQEEWKNEGTEENEEIENITEITVIPEESKETAIQMGSKIEEENEQLFIDVQESFDDIISVSEETKESTGIRGANDSILEIINAIIKALYENIVRAVLLYSRMNGFLLLRCIIDNPAFDATIYEIDDIAYELKFLKSLYNDVEMCLCLKKQGYRQEFISCIFLFEIVELIERNEIDNLLVRGVVETTKIQNFSISNLFLISLNDVKKLYQMDAAIVANFDLLIDHRFFISNLYTAKQTLESKPLAVQYVNIHFQLLFFKLLIRQIEALCIEDLDKLVDLKLCSEENRKDDCRYSVLQAQEAIRNMYGRNKGVEKLARNLCCQLIFYCETEWFWSEIIRLINMHIGMSFAIVQAFQLLPTVTEYLAGRKEPKNKTSLNLFYFIKQFLMTVPHKEFIDRRYAFFISSLCSSILNPATVINKILIPNLKQPIRKICAAVTIGKLLDSKNVNIAWSFDYTKDTNYDDDDENATIETEEKVEMIRIIGIIYSQYTPPLRNTIHGARYFYIDLVLSKLEKRFTRWNAFENCFTPNALKYLDELIAEKEFTWQTDYYLSKVLLRKLLDARKVSLPEKPRDNAEQYEYVEWVNQLLPITYAGVRSRAFFALAHLIDRFSTNSDLECAFVLRFNDIPEFFFIEFLVLFKIFMRSNKTNRLANLCKHLPGRYGSLADKNLQEMIKWLFYLINRVCVSGRIGDTAILHAKHRVLHWAEAYITNSEALGTDDAKAMLLLLKWSDEPGLKDDELNRGMNRLSFEIYHKSMVWPDNLTYEMIQSWSLYDKSTEKEKQYLKNYIPAACPSSIKVYKPTRLLVSNPPTDVFELQERNISSDLQTETESTWQTSSSRNRDIHFQQERISSSQSLNLPESHDDLNGNQIRNSEMFGMQTPYDPRFVMPVDTCDNEPNIGASAESTKSTMPIDQEQTSTTLQEGISGPMKNLQPIPLKMFGKGIYPTYCSVPEQGRKKKRRTLFHPFLEVGRSCKNCGLIDHIEKFCPKMQNYSNLLKKLLPVTYIWTIKKENTFENLQRQDSWGSFDDEEDD